MLKIFGFLFFISFISCYGTIQDNYQDLIDKKLIQSGDKPLLHLGCGESYLSGYINIDLPFEDRPLHSKNGPDYFYNILDLRFPNNSIRKIENHHMFEHFSRPVSLALLCAWTLWLDQEGKLVIETPDFENGIKHYLSISSFQSRQVILRHLFGSHEAYWAYHYDGWSQEKFDYVLSKLGYTIEDVKYFSWKDTDNITVYAKKTTMHNLDELCQICHEILRLSCVDKSPSEINMWQGWCKDFDIALSKMICEP